MKQSSKKNYAEPMLVKREQLRDVTAGVGAKYKEKGRDKTSDQAL
ncbi:MAG: hypothetical protein U0172_05205 [Nitrospiraceae bacterium]